MRALHSISLDLLPQVRKVNAARLHMREDAKAQERDEVGVLVFLFFLGMVVIVNGYIHTFILLCHLFFICLIVCVMHIAELSD